MSTEKQIKANQENGKLGGVKTEEGKAVSRYNALKHGLLSKEVLIEDEDKNEFSDLIKSLRSELKPASEIELLLVDKITADTWRLKRAIRIEKEMIEEGRENEDFMGNTVKKSLGEEFRSDFADYDRYGKFTRYLVSIERAVYRALHELERLQAKRNGQTIPPPVMVDVDVNNKE
jgi:hypothetical protein